MIPEAEVRRLAGRWGVDPMVVDLDYVLGCFLASLYRQTDAPVLRFKGATCLRKCYFADYRSSGDLDFTAEERLRPDQLKQLLAAAAGASEESWQIEFAVRPIRVETATDELGGESYQARVYYRGPLRRRGDPRAIRVDVTADEVLVFPPVRQPVLHPYTDADKLWGMKVPCCDLLEMLAEKIRALAGQGRYAISRDLYDVRQLLARHRVDIARLTVALPRKMEIKGVPAGRIDLERLRNRRDGFRIDWERNLLHLLPPGEAGTFDSAWREAIAFLERVNQALRRQGCS